MRLTLCFQKAQEDEKQQASRREFSERIMLEHRATTTDDRALDLHNVSFTAVASRHSREIRVPRETFYEFVDKTMDRFAETSEILFALIDFFTFLLYYFYYILLYYYIFY